MTHSGRGEGIHEVAGFGGGDDAMEWDADGDGYGEGDGFGYGPGTLHGAFGCFAPSEPAQ